MTKRTTVVALALTCIVLSGEASIDVDEPDEPPPLVATGDFTVEWHAVPEPTPVPRDFNAKPDTWWRDISDKPTPTPIPIRVSHQVWTILTTSDWRVYAAHIVASEARGVPSADIVVACTLVRDVERGWHPWNLRKRWFGWGTPNWADYAAVDQALTLGGCDWVPSYRYVGTLTDLAIWRARGMVLDQQVDVYEGTIVGVRW